MVYGAMGLWGYGAIGHPGTRAHDDDVDVDVDVDDDDVVDDDDDDVDDVDVDDDVYVGQVTATTLAGEGPPSPIVTESPLR